MNTERKEEMNSSDPEFKDIIEKNVALEAALFDVRRVVRYLQHSSETYTYFRDDPHLVAAKTLAELVDKRLTKLSEA